MHRSEFTDNPMNGSRGCNLFAVAVANDGDHAIDVPLPLLDEPRNAFTILPLLGYWSCQQMISNKSERLICGNHWYDIR
jgi:hypothetical protein